MSQEINDLLIGAHTSISGGHFHALLQGQEIGANTVQIFTANQRQWHSAPLSEEAILQWEKTQDETGIRLVMSHASYLINLGSPSPENLAKSRKAMQQELARCHALGIQFLNFHPGAALDDSVQSCLDRIVASLKELEKQAQGGPTKLLLETTAGQGSCVGHSFSELGYLVKELEHIVPIGVCLDTCHVFAAGYDVRSEEGWEEVLRQFSKEIGLKHLCALHVNDSMKPLGSLVDRHASLGKGEIGKEGFMAMMRHPHLRLLPKYLETPDPSIWKEEIHLLRRWAN